MWNNGLEIIFGLLIFFIIVFIVSFPPVTIYFWLKKRRIKKNIPEDLKKEIEDLRELKKMKGGLDNNATKEENESRGDDGESTRTDIGDKERNDQQRGGNGEEGKGIDWEGGGGRGYSEGRGGGSSDEEAGGIQWDI